MENDKKKLTAEVEELSKIVDLLWATSEAKPFTVDIVRSMASRTLTQVAMVYRVLDNIDKE